MLHKTLPISVMPLRARSNFVKTHGTNRITEKQGETNEYFRAGLKMRFSPEEKNAYYGSKDYSENAELDNTLYKVLSLDRCLITFAIVYDQVNTIFIALRIHRGIQ